MQIIELHTIVRIIRLIVYIVNIQQKSTIKQTALILLWAIILINLPPQQKTGLYQLSYHDCNIQFFNHFLMDKKQSLNEGFPNLDPTNHPEQKSSNNVTIQSEFNGEYFQQLSLNPQIAQKIKDQWKPILKEREIIYNENDSNSELMTIEIVSHSINYEIVMLKIHCGPFEFTLNIYNTSDSSPYEKLSTNAQGNFGKIIFTDLFEHQAAVKLYQFDQKTTPLELQLVDVLRQYSFLLIASALKVGPTLFPNTFFDLIIFRNSIVFYMEKCTEYRNFSSIQLDVNLVQLKENLKILHAFHIVHMDVKTQNICYSPLLKKYVFIDFGFSNYLKENVGEKSMTRFSGSLRYCSEQMVQLYLSNEYASVDLYYNDVVGLLISIEQILSYFTDLSKLQNRQLNQEGQFGDNQKQKLIVKVVNQNRIPQLLNTLQMKLFLFYGYRQNIYLLIDKISKYHSSKISIQAMHDYFDELEPTPELIEFYSNFFKRYSKNQNLQHQFVNRINYQHSKKNKVKFEFLFKRIDFLQHYHVKYRDDRFNKHRQRVQIRNIIFDLDSILLWNEEVYYKIFVDFISINSNLYEATENQKTLAVTTFFKGLQAKKQGKEFIAFYASKEQQYPDEVKAEEKDLNLCLCYLLNECSKSPITNWKQQYFAVIFQQIVLIGGGTSQFLQDTIKQFITNCRDQQASMRGLIGVQAALEWLHSFYYQTPKYYFCCQNFLLSIFEAIKSKCQTKQQNRICLIYSIIQNFRYNQRFRYNDLSLHMFYNLVNQTNFRKRQFKHEICIYMICCYLSNVVAGSINYEQYGVCIKLLETEQLKGKHKIQYFNSLIAGYYRVINKYQQLMQYYQLFLQIFGERYMQRMQLRADILVLQYTFRKITINDYVSELYRMYEANKKLYRKGRMQQIYVAINPDYRTPSTVLTSETLSKITILQNVIEFDEDIAAKVFIHFDLLNVFHIYHLIHQKQPNIIEHMQNMLNIITKCFEEFKDKERYERYFRCRYQIIKTKLLCWQQKYTEALQVYKNLIQKQAQNQQATLILIYSLNCAINIKLVHTNLSIDDDVFQLYSLCKRWHCFSEYFVLTNGGKLMNQTATCLFKQKGLDFLYFIFYTCFFLTNHPSEPNVNKFYYYIYNGIIAISKNNPESKCHLIQLSIQKLLPLIQKNPYLCLYFSILIKISPVKDLLNMLRPIAKTLKFVIPFVRIIVLHDYYYYYAQQLQCNQKKKKYVMHLHFKSAYQHFTIGQINRYFLKKNNFSSTLNRQFRERIKSKLMIKFICGQNLKKHKK